MDGFLQKATQFAEQQFQNMNQNQGQGQGQQGNYGGGQQQQYGGGNNYDENQNQGQGGYGGNQGSQGNQGSYGGNQGSYGGNQGGGGGGGGEYGVTGGAEYNRPHGQGGAGFQSGGGVPNIDQSAAISAANAHASNGNENASLFSTALSHIGGINPQNADVDEDEVKNNHQQAYAGNAGNLSANAMGSAAAMQAMKMFTSGQSGAASGEGGNMQSKLIGMAMSEAAKLFDQSGGAASGTKQDAVSGAGATIMKLMMKSQVSGMMGGSNSGGLSSLMGLANKFM